jgi:hypothetical protein
MEKLQYLLGNHTINEQSDPYTSADFTEVGGNSGEAVAFAFPSVTETNLVI